PFITAPMGGGAAPGGSEQAVVLPLPNSPTENPAPTGADSALQTALVGSGWPPSSLSGIGPSSGDTLEWRWQAGRPLDPASAGGAAAASDSSSRPPLQRSAIGAVWSSVDDTDHPTSWWSSGRPADSPDDPSDTSPDGSLDQLLNLLAF